MKYLKFPVLAILVFLIIGCGTKDPISTNSQAQTPVIMPLKVGNVWTYKVRLYGPTSPTPMDSINWQIKIAAQQVSNDTTWYRVLHIISQQGYVDTMEVYYTNLANGLYMSGTPSGAFLKLLYPATSGQSFTARNEWYGSSLSVDVISTNISISTTLGNYQCVYYKTPYSTYRLMHEYYKPNMGMAKMEWEYYDNTYGWYTDVVFDLIAMTLN